MADEMTVDVKGLTKALVVADGLFKRTGRTGTFRSRAKIAALLYGPIVAGEDINTMMREILSEEEDAAEPAGPWWAFWHRRKRAANA